MDMKASLQMSRLAALQMKPMVSAVLIGPSDPFPAIAETATQGTVDQGHQVPQDSLHPSKAHAAEKAHAVADAWAMVPRESTMGHVGEDTQPEDKEMQEGDDCQAVEALGFFHGGIDGCLGADRPNSPGCHSACPSSESLSPCQASLASHLASQFVVVGRHC